MIAFIDYQQGASLGANVDTDQMKKQHAMFMMIVKRFREHYVSPESVPLLLRARSLLRDQAQTEKQQV